MNLIFYNMDFIALLRPKQWVKNFLVFAAIIFSLNLLDFEYLIKTTAAFLLFCAISSSVYIFNDILDLEYDKNHPQKSQRPIASGRIKISHAFILAIVLAIISIGLSFYLSYGFGVVVSVYFIMNLVYSKFLKNLVIIDAMVIALGFVFRALAGAIVIKVEFSHWLLITTLLLALFLAFGKRRHELVYLQENATAHRSILKEYSPYFLDQMIAVVTASTLIVYILYTTSQEVFDRIGSNNLIYTIPFVLYGIFRYLYLIHKKEQGGSPTKILLTDKPILIDVFLWAISVIIVIYFL